MEGFCIFVNIWVWVDRGGWAVMAEGEEKYKGGPKMCCSINKVVPLEPIIAEHKVWISGLISHETDFRSRLRVFEKQGDIVKFHPLIDIDEGVFYLSIVF